ncbi:uncharacterized protein DUF2877 [Serratia fonticola]|uniref:Uncharacterized protein DUF2877 n=1 Tax=Serratia fonticola TaxID=47917 RepID=A0A559T3T4_SERFO|nr:DUF2877 domain-containing protein [Serratia fonticola]TQI78244.1 uncharacterized protein DUF2877 [Serratia fonticola]TQI94758.1 uncharacterized protein DUF2877 [Serratia fonticola]TVZ69256.1 uncharacterized protein DUF2877 [Serratia fonticola]
MAVTAFSALSVGYLAASRLANHDRLQVHSCFQRSLNLRHPDGYLLPLLSGDFQDLPDAIRIPVSGEWDWRHHAQIGQLATFQQGTLQGGGWCIALGLAPRWQPAQRLPEANPLALLDTLSHYATLAWQLGQYCHQHHSESDVQLLPGMVQSGALRYPPPRIVTLGLTDSPEQLAGEVNALIGYGRGLTPDGDDYLLGYMAALWPWRKLPAIASHDSVMRRLIGSQLACTNDISRHYLARALEGHFSAPIDQLMSVLGSATSTTQVQAAALEVMQFGASSGVDCLAGILHGLRTLRSSL